VTTIRLHGWDGASDFGTEETRPVTIETQPNHRLIHLQGEGEQPGDSAAVWVHWRSKPLDVLNADFYRKISSYPPPRATGSRSRPRAIRSAKKVGERAFDAAKDEARQASDREEKTADSKDEKEGTASEVKAR
jgi:hypothetical protein